TGGHVDVATDNLGYVFQDATLLPWRTVQKNVELFLELHGVDRARRTALATEAIALVGLTGFERHHPKRLSGGIKMRVPLGQRRTAVRDAQDRSHGVSAGRPLGTAAWPAGRLGDADLRGVDCRWYLHPFDQRDGLEEYTAGHIPGAVHLDWDREIADPQRGGL